MLKAYIIGIEGNLRNPSLPSEVSRWFQVIESNGYVSAPDEWESLVHAGVFEAMLSKSPTAGEVACFLAHLNAWLWLADSNETALAVFEDDIELVGDPSGALKELQALSGPWQVSLERRPGDFLWTHLVPRTKRLWPSRVQPRGTGAYVISRDAARRLVDDFHRRKRIDGVADSSLMQTELVEFYVCIPPPINVLQDSVSLIGARNPKRKRALDYMLRVKRLFVLNSSNPRKLTSYLKLKVLKPLKYLFSLHFSTAWIRQRLRRP